MKTELILSAETSDEQWFEIFSYEETDNDKTDIQELFLPYDPKLNRIQKLLDTIPTKEELDLLEGYWMKKTNSLVDGYNIALPHFINIKS